MSGTGMIIGPCMPSRRIHLSGVFSLIAYEEPTQGRARLVTG
jgi:hypothetical protein